MPLVGHALVSSSVSSSVSFPDPAAQPSSWFSQSHPTHRLSLNLHSDNSILITSFASGTAGKEFHCNSGSIPGSGRSPGEGIGYPLQYSWASLVAQMVRNLPAVHETWVQSVGWEDPLEKGMATHSSILAWKIPWTEGPGGL